ncbi:MAG: hypothetical protein ACFE8P_16600, partial [Promethearchaeota archaeon]
PECSTLLKIQEEFVEMFMSEEKGEDEFYSIEDIEEEAVALENIREEIVLNPEVKEDLKMTEKKGDIESTEEISKEIDKTETDGTKKVRIGGFFGKEIEVKANANVKEKTPIQTRVVNIKTIDVEKSITSLKPPKKRKAIKLCNICGATVYTSKCPNCGAHIQ